MFISALFTITKIWKQTKCPSVDEWIKKPWYMYTMNTFWPLKIRKSTLAGVAQWIECWPVNQKVASLTPSQGTCLGCGPGPQLGVYNRQLINVSLAH